MARKKGNTGSEQKVVDYRYDDEKRKNIPPAGLAAQGKIREKPKIRYAYNPHLPPILRFDKTGKTDGLPELIETARTRPLTVEKGEPLLLPILDSYKPIGSMEEVNFKTTRPCYPTTRSHINQVVADTNTWEQSAAFRLEQAKVVYVRNDHLEFVIPYEYLGVSHAYVPDFLVRLSPDLTLALEIKGYEDDQDRAKHQAARRWVSAVNNWGQLGRWDFHVCKDPQMLGRELEWLKQQATVR